MDDKLKQLYQDVILHHSKNPHHFEKKEDATLTLKAYNPICGDKFELFLELNNGSIQEAHFHGFGCAISKAASSILIQQLEGKRLEEAQTLIQAYLNYLREEEKLLENYPPEFEAFAAAKSFPGRLQCATLSWEEVDKWLQEVDFSVL